jgi:hypothetical protein
LRRENRVAEKVAKFSPLLPPGLFVGERASLKALSKVFCSSRFAGFVDASVHSQKLELANAGGLRFSFSIKFTHELTHWLQKHAPVSSCQVSKRWEPLSIRGSAYSDTKTTPSKEQRAIVQTLFSNEDDAKPAESEVLFLLLIRWELTCLPLAIWVFSSATNLAT